MQDQDIKRLQDDLSTMRQAMKLGRPYDAGDLPALLLLATGGLAAIPLLEFTAWNPRLCLLGALLPGLLAYGRRYALTRRQQGERPALWQEYKLSAVLAVCAAVAAIGWIWWGQRSGMSREAAGAGVVFCLGVLLAGIGLMSANRRSYVLGGVGVVAFGMAIPWLAPHHIATTGAGLLVVLCLMDAAFIWWQTRLPAGGSGRSESLT